MNLIAAAVLLQQVVLTPAQQAKLTALGWPPAPPRVARRDDLVFRRDGGQAVLGSLTALHAFATVTTTHGPERVGRDHIGIILVNGSRIPTGVPVLPLDSDAVVLRNGSKVVGRVEVSGDVINVGARTLRQADVMLIRLRDPTSGQPSALSAASGPNAPGGPPTTGSGGAGARRPGAPPAAPSTAPRPRSSNEIPWGQALWRGVLRFEHVPSSNIDRETGSYYVTWAESIVGSPPYIAAIQLRPVSLVYNYLLTVPEIGSCQAFTFTKSGSGFDGWNRELTSGVVFQLPLAGMGADVNRGAGRFQVNVFSPVFVPAGDWPKVCGVDDQPRSPPYTEGNGLPSFSFGNFFVENDCHPDPDSLRMPPPYVTIAGDVTCGEPDTYKYLHLRWQFDRGVPPIDPTINQKPCETPEALLSLSKDQRQAMVDRLKQIAAQFDVARTDEARFRQTKDQLQPAFNLMIVAAAGSDLGTRLLEIAVSDGLLKTAAATGQITQAQREFIGNLTKFIKSYEAWTEMLDDPSGWGHDQLVGDGKEMLVGEDNLEIIEGALELVGYGHVLADAIGQGDGSAALDYIEENLGKFGPLIPEYSINKARQYVEVARQWSAALKTMARLSAEGANLAGQIAEADLGIQVRQAALDDCNRANPSK